MKSFLTYSQDYADIKKEAPFFIKGWGSIILWFFMGLILVYPLGFYLIDVLFRGTKFNIKVISFMSVVFLIVGLIIIVGVLKAVCIRINNQEEKYSAFVLYLGEKTKKIDKNYRIAFLRDLKDENDKNNPLNIIRQWSPLILTCIVGIQASIFANDNLSSSTILANLTVNSNDKDNIINIIGHYATFLQFFWGLIGFLAINFVYYALFSKTKVISKGITEAIYKLYSSGDN